MKCLKSSLIFEIKKKPNGKYKWSPGALAVESSILESCSKVTIEEEAELAPLELTKVYYPSYKER